MADDIYANAAYLRPGGYGVRGDDVATGISWMARTMMAIEPHGLGATVIRCHGVNFGGGQAGDPVLWNGAWILIGGNPYQVASTTAAPYTITLQTGLIAAMDWTLASRLVESPMRKPTMTFESVAGANLNVRLPALWGLNIRRGCRLTYSGATVTVTTGFPIANFDTDFFGPSVTTGLFTIAAGSPHAGIIGEAITAEDARPSSIGNGSQFQRGRSLTYVVEQDATVSGVTYRKRVNLASSSGLIIRPYVVPLPAADALGIPYTEDSVGVWIDDRLYGVPRTLPTGYLPSRADGEAQLMFPPAVQKHAAANCSVFDSSAEWGQPSIAFNTTAEDVSWPKNQRILHAGGVYHYDWSPRQRIDGITVRGSGLTATSNERSIGWRMCRMTTGTLTYSSRYRIGYCDYTTGLNEVDVYSGSLTASTVVDLGPLLPPLGKVRRFYFLGEYLHPITGLWTPFANLFSCQLTPRVDVPFPWNCHGCEIYRAGTANMFARGGYHPDGILSPPGNLNWSNVNQADDPARYRNADLRALSPGGTLALHSDASGWAGKFVLRLTATTEGTYTLSKTGAASKFSEVFPWHNEQYVVTNSGTSISVKLSPLCDRFFLVDPKAIGESVSLA